MAQPPLLTEFLKNRDGILAYIFTLTRNFDAAEEIFQEVSVAILEEAGKKVTINNFPAWAREVARRRVADFYRKAAKLQKVKQLSDAMTDMVCQAFAENEELLEEQQHRMKYMLECLERLQGRSREVIESFYHKRQSIKQIAVALGWQGGSVKVALSRARKVLTDCIQVKMQKPQVQQP